jgi:hypothetical protein
MRPRLQHLRAPALALLLLSLGATAAAAQRVTGQVVDRETGAAIGTAFLILLDPSGVRLTSTLSNGEGRFALDAPRPGRYRLTVERIGYRSFTSAPFELAEGQVLAQRLAVASDAVQLQGITAVGERRCVVRPQEGLRLHQLWEEARKALAVATWTQEQPGLHFEAVAFERIRNRRTLEIEEERVESRRGLATDPFATGSAEELVASGYVQRAADGSVIYHGLDARHILSDAFLDTHCFRVQAPGRGERGLIGLAFQPVRSQRMPDVQGVLWLDARTAELRYLEYRYTRHGHAAPLPRAPFGGRTEFRRLENGYWIAARWWIRMPEVRLIEVRPGVAQGARLVVREAGAEVVEVLAAPRGEDVR